MDADTRERIERMRAHCNSTYDVMMAFMGWDTVSPSQDYCGNFKSALIDLLERSDPNDWTDERLREWGLVRLPVDANGEAINIGDTIREDEDGHTFRVDGFELIRGEWFAYEYYGIRAPASLCHRLPPVTVESVLREFLSDSEDAMRKGYDEVPREVFAEYAKRLRLAKEDE